MTSTDLAIIRDDGTAVEPFSRRTLPSPRDVVAVLFRQRWAMAGVFAIVVAAVFLSGMWVPKYEAQMKIFVRHQRSDEIMNSSANDSAQYGNNQVTEEDLNTEVELLNSHELLRKVVVETGLSGNPRGASGRESEIRIAKAVRALSSSLKIEPLRKTNVIVVRYQATNPELAAEVLSALSTAYTEKHTQIHRPSGELTFFDQQMAQYKHGLDQAQAQLTNFTHNTGVVAADQERDSALRQANDFDAIARQAEATMQETEQRVHVLESQLHSVQPRMTTVVRTLDNPQLLEQLKSTLLNLELKRSDLLTKYEPTYRLVQEADRQIADAKSAIAAEESKPLRDESSDLDPNYQWIRAELTKAQSELSGLRARAASAAAIAAQYHQSAKRLDENGLVQQDLLRAAKTQEENYLLYAHKREEARISDALDKRGILNVAVAEQPVVPALPNRSPLSVAFLTLLLAGTLSISTAFVFDLMAPSFRTPDEMANYLGTPVLAALPKGGE